MCGWWFPPVMVTQFLDEPRRRLPGTTSQKPREWCNGKLWYSNIHRFCNSTCSEILPKIRSNLTWHSNMLKMKYLPKKHPRKIRNRRPRRANARNDQKRRTFRPKTRYCAHPQEVDTTIVPETRVPDVRLSIPAVSCVVTSASAGIRGQFLPKWLELLILLYFSLM